MKTTKSRITGGAATVCAIALTATLWAAPAQAAAKQGAGTTCGAALAQTTAHASGHTTFRHRQGTASRSDSFDLGSGGTATYRSGWSHIYGPPYGWRISNSSANLIGDVTVNCSPPPVRVSG